MRKRLFEILEIAPAGDTSSKFFDVFILLVIVINILSVILETVDSLYTAYASVFYWIELLSVALFTVEYILRLWVCTTEEEYSHPIGGRLRYLVSPLTLIDFLAILPFYLPMMMTVDLRLVRILRLFRVFRLFKLARYIDELQRFGSIIRDKKEDIILGIFSVLVMIILSSSIVYVLEHDAQPEAFSSIPASMWWGVATLTTVGYGDVYPITPLGKLFGAFIAVFGIGLFAVPAGILASAYMGDKGTNICPHCRGNL